MSGKVNVQLEAAIHAILYDQPVAYHPVVAKAVGSVTAGILLSQLLYWTPRGGDPDGWIWKTQDQIYEETGLGRREQETARRYLVAAGVLEEKRAGVPAKLFFRIDVTALTVLIGTAKTGGTSQSSMAESANQERRDPPNKRGAIRPTITETTAETTTESTNRDSSSKSSKHAHAQQNERSAGVAATPKATGMTPVGATLAQRRVSQQLEPSETPQLDAAIEDISQKFGNTQVLRSNLSQARRLWTESGLQEVVFVHRVVWPAFAIAKDRRGTARKPMPYFFECARDTLAKLNDPSRRPSLAGRYARQVIR